jgi:hypothetical protein
MLYISVVKMYKLRETSFMIASPQVEIWAQDIREMKQVLDCELQYNLVPQYKQYELQIAIRYACSIERYKKESPSCEEWPVDNR